MIMFVDENEITCCYDTCGITFKVPARWYQEKRDKHTYFYCPNGHKQHLAAETELDRTRRERDIAIQDLARVEEEAALARRDAEKAHRETNKLKKRASAGTCPCCQRSFANMSEHMKRQHPQFIMDMGTKVIPIKVAK